MSDDPTTRILAEISALRGDLGRIEGSHASLCGDLLAKIGRLHDAIANLRYDVAINMAATDRAEIYAARPKTSSGW